MISFFLLFFIFVFFSSTHVSPFPARFHLLFLFIFQSLLLQDLHTISVLFVFIFLHTDRLLHTFERRPVEIESNRKDKAIRVTMQSHLVLLPTARQIGLSLLSFSFFLIFLFWFNFVVIIKNRFCFVFWLCKTFESLREKQRN